MMKMTTDTTPTIPETYKNKKPMTTPNKRYRLKKDLPGFEKGAVAIYLNSIGFYQLNTVNEFGVYISKYDVEGSPFFEEILPEPLTEQEKFWAAEVKKCIESPYYYATKYLTINGKLFTTRLSESEFNNYFKKVIPDWDNPPQQSKSERKVEGIDGDTGEQDGFRGESIITVNFDIRESIEKSIDILKIALLQHGAKHSKFISGVDMFSGNFEWRDTNKNVATFKFDPNGKWRVRYEERSFDQKEFEANMKEAAKYFSKVPLLCEECGEIGKHEPNCPQADERKLPEGYIEYVEEENRKNPGWMIETVKNKDGIVKNREYWFTGDVPNHGFDGNSYGYFLTKIRSPFWEILSVRRLTDNVILKVGEEVKGGIIEGFDIVFENVHPNRLRVLFKDGGGQDISYIQKLPSTSTQQPASGESVTIKLTKENYYSPNPPEQTIRIKLSKEQSDKFFDDLKSTQQEPEKKDLMGVPCLSVKDIWRNVDCVLPNGFLKISEKKLIQLAKSKTTINP